jgi:transposase
MGAPKKQDWREARRQQAYRLHQEGWKQKQIAQAVGVNQSSVSKWLKKAREEGEKGLESHPAPGAKRRMTEEQRADLVKQLGKGAEAHGYRGERWTTQRVVDLIARLYEVNYHRAHASRLLREMNWTQQQPAVKASQRNEEEIDRWKTEHWPAIKKSA